MDQTHIYDLAFVSPKRRPRTPPEIVFIIDERHLPEVSDRLHKVTERFDGFISAYLGPDGAPLTLPIPDLFGNKEFGFGKCGYWIIEGGEVHFHLQLRPYPWTHYCSLTIFALTKALGFPFETVTGTNRQQDVGLLTLCDLGRSSGYGHAVGGYLSSTVHEWLKKYAKGEEKMRGIIEATPMHPEVIRAQQAAWHAISTEHKRKYASRSHIYGWVHDSGAFSMNCFGDACDLSVYLDGLLERAGGPIELGCHNLDNPDQQLTLLAGLAKICQLARESS